MPPANGRALEPWRPPERTSSQTCSLQDIRPPLRLFPSSSESMSPAASAGLTGGPKLTRSVFVLAAGVATAVGALPAGAQEADRLWGRVSTVSGESYEGFILWQGGVDGASWTDFVESRTALAPDRYRDWLVAADIRQPVRTIEVPGYRVSWNEEHPDFPSQTEFAVRFGHLAAVSAPEGGAAEFVFRPGSGLGQGERAAGRLGIVRPRAYTPALWVYDRDEGPTRVNWGELERVDFEPAPAGTPSASSVSPRAAPGEESFRLYGTVEDRFGRSFTGYIAWDSDEILGSEELDGSDEERNDHSIAFEDIAEIERSLSGSRVTLRSGKLLELSGSNDVDSDNRGVRVFDPALGVVEVEWEEFGLLRLHPPAGAVAAYESFVPAHSLSGTVTTQDGNQFRGRIRWDAEHELSWELLRGESEGVKFGIEFGHVAGISRLEVSGARVTLRDGRSFELSGTPDFDWDNRGIFVFPAFSAADGEAGDGQLREGEEQAWRYITWEEFAEVRFSADPNRGDDS